MSLATLAKRQLLTVTASAVAALTGSTTSALAAADLVKQPAFTTPNQLAPSVAGAPVKDIVGGLPPDSPNNRIDPNLPTSRFTGVVSIFLDAAPVGDGFGFLCSGTAISSTRIVTAGHCLDGLVDDGQIEFAPQDVVVFANYDNWDPVLSPGFVPPPTFANVAESLYIHPNYTGFLNPTINDDVAVITLKDPLPGVVETYPIYTGTLGLDDEIVMVGYGLSGYGDTGHTVGASFRRKRVGGNVVDFVDPDDEGSGADEIYYWDFDAPDGTDGPLGGPSLGNLIEAGSGGGDSGGPAFVERDGRLYLAGVHTFGLTFFEGQIQGTFGTGGGGMILAPYAAWVTTVPETSTVVASTALVGLAGLTLLRRRARR